LAIITRNNNAHSAGSNIEIPRKNLPDRVFIAISPYKKILCHSG
jgi:hypothetical protein